MWETFLTWGQHYGLQTTIILFILIIFMMRAEKKKLFTSIEKLRLENAELKRSLSVHECSEVHTDV